MVSVCLLICVILVNCCRCRLISCMVVSSCWFGLFVSVKGRLLVVMWWMSSNCVLSLMCSVCV